MTCCLGFTSNSKSEKAISVVSSALNSTDIFTLNYLVDIIFPNNYMTEHYNYQLLLKIDTSTRKHYTFLGEYNFNQCQKVTQSISSYFMYL